MDSATRTVLVFTGPETTELSARESLACHGCGQYPRAVPRARFLPLLAVVAMVVAACGGGLGVNEGLTMSGESEAELSGRRAEPSARIRRAPLAGHRAERTTRLPTEVWIDYEVLVRQLRYEYPLRDSSRGRLVFTTHLSEFGIAVDVAPPPDDEVTDILDLMPAGE
jgi:hypothetical protein